MLDELLKRATEAFIKRHKLFFSSSHPWGDAVTEDLEVIPTGLEGLYCELHSSHLKRELTGKGFLLTNKDFNSSMHEASCEFYKAYRIYHIAKTEGMNAAIMEKLRLS